MPIKMMTPEVLVSLSAAPTTPTPVSGEMYFDTTIGRVGWYTGSAWVYPATPGYIPTASSAPSGYVQGRMYYDTTLNSVGVYNGSAFQYLPMGVTSTNTAITAAVSGTTGAVALTLNPQNVPLSAFASPVAYMAWDYVPQEAFTIETSSGPGTGYTGRLYFDTTQGALGVYNGSAWQYTQLAATGVVPGGRCYATSAATTLGTSFAQQIWAGTSYTRGGITYSTSTGAFTVPIAGVYHISGQIATGNSGGTTYPQISYYHNGTAAGVGSRGETATSTDSCSVITDTVVCAASDTLAPGGRSSTAATALDTSTFGAGVQNFFSVQFMSR